MASKTKSFSVFAAFALCALIAPARANNLAVKHVALRNDVAGSHVMVRLDVSWENSWRNDLAGAGQAAPFNYDAAWLFVKFSTDGGSTWRHATLSASSTEHTVGNDNGVAAKMQAVPDGKGAFLFRAQNGSGANTWSDVQLRWNYVANGLSSSANVIVNVLALETVYVPAGNFFVGDQSPSPINGQFEKGTSGAPLEITGEGALTLGGGSATSLGNNNAQGMAHLDDFNDTVSKALPAAFPKGHAAFYIMKHEITQGQYADFLNLLTSAQASRRNVSSVATYQDFRGTISGAHPLFAASANERACNFLSWLDAAAYADWAGLRPMTELEYEKAGRGNQAVVAGEYAWGNAAITRQTSHGGVDGSGAETASPASANANFDSGINGPVRAGIFAATSAAARAQAGASYFGVMELSGNVWERVITLANSVGRNFTGTHGDGELSNSAGAEGNANVATWPGTNAVGSGLRGGAWKDEAKLLRLADRACAATPDAQRVNHYGFRGVRTAP